MDKLKQAAKDLEDMQQNGITYTYVLDNETLMYMIIGIVVTLVAAMWIWKKI